MTVSHSTIAVCINAVYAPLLAHDAATEKGWKLSNPRARAHNRLPPFIDMRARGAPRAFACNHAVLQMDLRGTRT